MERREWKVSRLASSVPQSTINFQLSIVHSQLSTFIFQLSTFNFHLSSFNSPLSRGNLRGGSILCFAVLCFALCTKVHKFGFYRLKCYIYCHFCTIYVLSVHFRIWNKSLLPHKCGAWWTQVWSKSDTCTEQTQHKCRAISCLSYREWIEKQFYPSPNKSITWNL